MNDTRQPQAVSDVTDLFDRLEHLNRIGVALSQETNLDRLLEAILIAAKDITRADGGTLYRVVDEGRQLKFEIMRNDTLNVAMGGTTGNPIPFPPLALHDEYGAPIHSMVAAYVYHHDRSVNIADAYTEAGFDFSGTRKFDESIGYRSQSFLAVPMKNHENEIIGVLQLLNARDANGRVVPFSTADQRLTESLASQAAIALTNRLLITHLENLFESFIGLINAAIDDKSPYTGGHCERVPELTMMLAEAVNKVDVGPLRDFQMTDKDRYELKIAGLLHDCGKVTTPVHVVDKATKLQTIFDRIHLIDTRFEVIKRDAEIKMLRARNSALEKNDEQELRKIRNDYEIAIREINGDREFLRFANIGSEAMSLTDQARVREIAKKYRWRIDEGNGEDTKHFLSEDEVENLVIRSGTLTTTEREIINHHIDVTIQMLEALPWPRHLKNVPEYAGGHHERMDGKGYPRGLTRSQMSVQARCMGIADIFEALTARDRPYKKGKTLSESLAILGKMKLSGHIDPDLFDVFIREKVYLRYAETYLDPQQIDDVDVTTIPGYAVLR